MNHVLNMSETIRPLQPVSIYLHQNDLKATLYRAIRERAPEWLAGVQNYCLGKGYGRKNEVAGIEGLVRFLSERNTIEQEILQLVFKENKVLD
ncbi:MAG: hypothetical protein ACM32O_14020 [Clostridia bacterium]